MNVREALVEWLSGNGLIQAGAAGAVDTTSSTRRPRCS